MERIVWFETLGMGDVSRVGGKNASLGEMIANLAATGVKVPGGFATTADAYREFLSANRLERRIDDVLGRLDVDDVAALARAGGEIRALINNASLGDALEREIRDAYATMANGEALSVAVRSSVAARAPVAAAPHAIPIASSSDSAFMHTPPTGGRNSAMRSRISEHGVLG